MEPNGAVVVPATHLKAGVCSVAGTSQPSYGPRRPSVAPHPLAVEVVWTPGLNDKHCQPVLVKGGTRIAAALGFDVDSAPFKLNAAQVVAPVTTTLPPACTSPTAEGRRNASTQALTDVGKSHRKVQVSVVQRASSALDLLNLAPAAWAPYLS